MINQKLFKDNLAHDKKKGEQSHVLKVPGKTRLTILQAGSGDNTGKCEGGTYTDQYSAGKEVYKGVVVMEYHVFEITSTNNDLVQLSDAVSWGEQALQEFNCEPSDGQCYVEPYMVVWTHSDGLQCPARIIRTVKGSVHSLPSGEVFLGNEDAPVALRKVTTRWICGSAIYETEFPGLAFTEHREYQYNESRPLRVSGLTADYVSRISFAYLTLGNEVRATLNQLEQVRCKRQQGIHDRVLRPLDVLGEETWRVGSVFFRQVAESIYSFRCNEVLVRAINARICTSDLRVELMPEYNRSILVEASHLYLRAGSRMLVTKSLPEPCTGAMVRKFKGVQGNWICQLPTVSNCERPLPMPDLDTLIVDVGLKDISGEEGLYTKEQQALLMTTLEGSSRDTVALRWLSSLAGVPGTGATFVEAGLLFQELTAQLNPSVFWRFLSLVYWVLGQLGSFICVGYGLSWCLTACKNVAGRISSFRELKRDETTTRWHRGLWVISPSLLKTYRDGFSGHAALRERMERRAAKLRRAEDLHDNDAETLVEPKRRPFAPWRPRGWRPAPAAEYANVRSSMERYELPIGEEPEFGNLELPLADAPLVRPRIPPRRLEDSAPLQLGGQVDGNISSESGLRVGQPPGVTLQQLSLSFLPAGDAQSTCTEVSLVSGLEEAYLARSRPLIVPPPSEVGAAAPVEMKELGARPKLPPKPLSPAPSGVPSMISCVNRH